MGRPCRAWTADEDKIVSGPLPLKTKCELLNCCHRTVSKRKAELGIRPVDIEARDAKIIEGWGTPVKILADRLDMSESHLYKRARVLGLRYLKFKWTAEKKAWLASNIEALGKKAAQKRLGCSRRGLNMMLWRLGIEDDMTRSTLTVAFVAHDFLNVHRETVERWIRLGLLSTVRGDNGQRVIKPKALRKFLIENPDRVDPRKIGDGWDMFISLVAGQWG